MRLTVVLAMGLAALTAVPAMAQKIAPSREYSSTPPATLDKNYGLPTFGTPGAGMPQQRTQAPKPGVKTDPDFFAPPPPAEAEGPSTPDFFSSTTDLTLPRAGRTRPGTASSETPLFTTGQGYSTGEGYSTQRQADRMETDDGSHDDDAAR
jgi:hypothetical protein